MGEWHTVPLGKVVTFQRGYDLPRHARKFGNIPIVSSAGVTDHHNVSMVDPPGIVTGRYGTIGEVFLITEQFWPLNTTLYVRDFHGNDPGYVYYLLQRFNFDIFSGKSGVPGVNRNDLHVESVTLPAEEVEQRAIATVLSDVDALLEGLDRLIVKPCSNSSPEKSACRVLWESGRKNNWVSWRKWEVVEHHFRQSQRIMMATSRGLPYQI